MFQNSNPPLISAEYWVWRLILTGICIQSTRFTSWQPSGWWKRQSINFVRWAACYRWRPFLNNPAIECLMCLDVNSRIRHRFPSLISFVIGSLVCSVRRIICLCRQPQLISLAVTHMSNDGQLPAEYVIIHLAIVSASSRHCSLSRYRRQCRGGKQVVL